MTDNQRATLLRSAIADLRKTEKGYRTHPHGTWWQRAMPKLEKLHADLAMPPVPALGPVLEDGLSMLLHACTHNTDGVPNHPAFDTGFNEKGRWIIAPERLTIQHRPTDAAGGDAVYAIGASGMSYWIGHIAVDPPAGKTFRKGERIARIADQAGTDHLHWGIDARPLIGRPLLYGGQRKPSDVPKDYRFGSPTIGAQLAAVLEA